MDEPKITTKFGVGNPGKPKGATNKINREIKEMIREALDGAGGVNYLIAKANSHPAAFLSLVGRVLPLQVTGELKHEHSGSLQPETQRLVDAMRGLGSDSAGPASLPH